MAEISRGEFRKIYLLMGEESYYPDLLCQAIMDNCIEESFRDFNQSVLYGNEVKAETVIDNARRFPMMSERNLVVLKEAQLMKNLENLAIYCDNPLDSTVLVILMHGDSADKRKALYKSVVKNGAVLDSPLMKDWELPKWIEGYFNSRGLQIEPEAAMLMAESVGTNLSAIALETDKLLKNLEQGCSKVRVQDIEKNVGVSRQFSIFEVSKALCYRQGEKALKIAAHLGNGAKFKLPMAVSTLYATFNHLLRYQALMARGTAFGPSEKAEALKGVNPYFYKDYDAAARNYPIQKTMQIISLLCEYDYLGKGGDGVQSEDGELFVELVAKILGM